MSKNPTPELTTGARLRSFIERVEYLEARKAEIMHDIREVYGEAKSTGFDTKTIRQIVKDRKLTEAERAEREALLDLYKAAIGMLDGTPLGSSALERLTKKPKPAKPPEDEAETPDAPEPEAEETPAAPAKPTAEDIIAARAAGEKAASEGNPVTSNPHPAHDPRRAAFDEGWCSAAGTDGMDIPDAWKPTKKSKKGEGDNNG